MKKIALILSLALALGAAPALWAQNFQSPRIDVEKRPEAQHGTQHGTHHGNRPIQRGATAPVPEADEEISTTEATPYSNTDFAPWDNHLNVDAPVIPVE
jgi:hypothetical protein